MATKKASQDINYVRMRTSLHYPFGKKLQKLRMDHGYNQQEVCIMLSDYLQTKKPIIIPTYSSWEQGVRYPRTEIIVALANLFNVSLDYLFDRQRDYDTPSAITTPDSVASAGDKPLKISQFPDFDSKPVFVHFKGSSYLNQWGILNLTESKVMCRDISVDLSNKIELYPMADQRPERKRLSTIEQMCKYQHVYIEMTTKDAEVNGQLTGYYKHSPDNQFLINESNAFTLPYYGLNRSYYAYMG